MPPRKSLTTVKRAAVPTATVTTFPIEMTGVIPWPAGMEPLLPSTELRQAAAGMREAADEMRAAVAELKSRRPPAAPETTPAITDIGTAVKLLMREVVGEARVAMHDQHADPTRADQSHAPTTGGVGEPDRYLTAEEAARMSGVAAPTVRRWVQHGKLPGHYAGRLLRVRLDELRAFLARDRSTGRPVDVEAHVHEILRKLG